MRKSLILAGLLMAPALCAPVAAQTPVGAPAPSLEDMIVNKPLPGTLRVDGVRSKPRVRKDETVQWGQAIRIEVPGKSPQAWSVAAASDVDKPIKAGDDLVLAFWARVEKGDGGGTTATLPYNAVQLSSAPYTAIFSGGVEIGPEWKLYEVKGKADKDYPAGTLNASLHLATGKQVIDIGPVFVLAMSK
jgi:hypothetical protein